MKQIILILTIPILFFMTALRTTERQKANDFTAVTIEGKAFKLSDLKGKKIFLSFFRNGACAMCNMRAHEISLRQKDFDEAGIVVIAVFESSIEDMKPYIGKQKLAFTLLSDPGGKLYELYGIRNSPDLVNAVITSGSASNRIAEATAAGFPLTPQEGANFFRIPAEVLIDENFDIVRVNHCEQLINHIPLDDVLKWQ